MNYWLVKSEPKKYSWEQFLKDGQTFWDGVRNFQARNNLKIMEENDLVLFYHSNEGKCVVGIAKVIKTAYQDPTTTDSQWVAVDIIPVKTLKKTVSLAQIKQEPLLSNISLIKQSRLSVMPIEFSHFELIVSLGS